jgi:hypothetical protein
MDIIGLESINIIDIQVMIYILPIPRGLITKPNPLGRFLSKLIT